MKNKRNLFHIVRDALLITLIVFTFIVSLQTDNLFAFFSIVILGIVLGLLTYVYNIESLDKRTQVAIHVIGSVLAILIVALINAWIRIDWGRLLTFVIVLAIIAVIGYGLFMYFRNKNNSAIPTDTTHSETPDNQLDKSYRENKEAIEDSGLEAAATDNQSNKQHFKDNPYEMSDNDGHVAAVDNDLDKEYRDHSDDISSSGLKAPKHIKDEKYDYDDNPYELSDYDSHDHLSNDPHDRTSIPPRQTERADSVSVDDTQLNATNDYNHLSNDPHDRTSIPPRQTERADSVSVDDTQLNATNDYNHEAMTSSDFNNSAQPEHSNTVENEKPYYTYPEEE